MRNAAIYAGLLATTFASLGQAMVNLTILSPVDDIRPNDGILVEWATDKTYVRPLPTSRLPIPRQLLTTHNTTQSLEFNFVKRQTWGWSIAKNFFDGRVADAGEGNITVIVPRVEAGR
jgi:hypothetical protein